MPLKHNNQILFFNFLPSKVISCIVWEEIWASLHQINMQVTEDGCIFVLEVDSSLIIPDFTCQSLLTSSKSSDGFEDGREAEESTSLAY